MFSLSFSNLLINGFFGLSLQGICKWKTKQVKKNNSVETNFTMPSVNCFSGKKQTDILNVKNPKIQIFSPEPKLMRTALGRDLSMTMNLNQKKQTHI